MSLARNLANLKPSSAGLIGSEDVDTSLGQLLGWSNRVINGDMRISQRGSVNVTPSGGNTLVAADRFAHFNYFGSGQINTEISTDAPPGFSYSLLSTVSTAVPLSGATGYYCQLTQGIEGFNISDLYSGNVVISFWVKSSVTGTYSVALYNTHQLGVASGSRVYVAEYTVNSANTWEQKFIVVNLGSGVSAGSWALNNNCGLSINWNLGAESNRKGNTYLNAWGTYTTTPNFQSANQVNWASNSGATFRITGVELRPGSVITLPFERRDIGRELRMSRRYYTEIALSTDIGQNGGNQGAGYSVYTSVYVPFAETMRASPTILQNFGVSTNDVGSLQYFATVDGYLVKHGNTNALYTYLNGTAKFSAEF